MIPSEHLPLLQEAARGAVLLTANRRLARHLRHVYDLWHQERGNSAWRTPEIYSLDLWLRRCVVDAGEGHRLLEAFAVQRLWEEIVAGSLQGTELLQVGAAARRAAEAHQLLCEYAASLEGEPLTADQDVFSLWRRQYQARLDEGDWIDPAGLPQVVCDLLQRGGGPHVERLFLVGFDQLPPRAVMLTAAVRACGGAAEVVFPAIEPRGSACQVHAQDSAEEIRSAARWVRQLLEQGETGIGVIVPDLTGRRRELERIFREELDPNSLIQLTPDEERFSLSLGTPLNELGPVRLALELLALRPQLDVEQVGVLLRSPFLAGGESEASARALFDLQLRRRGGEEISLATLTRLASSSVPQFAALLRRLAPFLRDGAKRSVVAWSVRFVELLRAVGWPGERPMQSVEFQVCRTFREKVLDGFAVLDRVSPPLGRGEAAAILRQLAASIEFQPERGDGPVQVVGMLEAGGLHFRHLWVMGLSANVLPAPRRPNPFLPVRLQVACGMPHAAADRELDYARRLFMRLLAAAPVVICSCPRGEGDMELAPSPFLADLPFGDPPLAASHAPVDSYRQMMLRCSAFTDDTGSPVASVSSVRGGIAVLKDQALCPFRAFARHRLEATALTIPEPGLDAAARGTLMHQVLEQFWCLTRDSDGLAALDAPRLHERVAACVAEVLVRAADRYGEQLSNLVRCVEEERLVRLVLEWLIEVERPRPSFVVLATEQTHRMQLAGLELAGRIDRIDQLNDSGILLIDYKGGNLPRIDDLCGERLLEPQLPAYALTLDAVPASGIALAGVKSGACGMLGVSAKAAGEGIRTVDGEFWAAQVERWREQLTGLAGAFAAGRATVAPVDVAKVCRYCDLPRLCRIADATCGIEGDET